MPLQGGGAGPRGPLLCRGRSPAHHADTVEEEELVLTGHLHVLHEQLIVLQGAATAFASTYPLATPMDADKVVEEKDCGIPGVLGVVEFDLNEQRLVVINVPMAVSDAEEVRITAVAGAKATEEGAVGGDEAALTRANSRGRRRGSISGEEDRRKKEETEKEGDTWRT
uniref:Uncharacterized protein n=1 Tax=Oryza meridionalis TaxID=40149 RepID=A0A0E0CW29_9ORYZ